MELGRAVAVVALLALAPALGAHAQRGAEGTTVLTDPEGDAYEYNAQFLHMACHEVTDEACEAFDAGGMQGVAPAPPDRDILALSFEETPDHLVVTLTLARVDGTLLGDMADDGWVSYRICWDSGRECVMVDRYDHGEARHPESYYRRERAESCSCVWEVPAELTAGAPGTIAWRVPRSFVANGTSGGTLSGPSAAVLHNTLNSFYGSSYEASGAPGLRGGEVGGFDYLVDITSIGQPFTFATEASGAPPPYANLRVDDTGDVIGEFDGRVDVLRTEIVETPSELGLALQLANVPADGSDGVVRAYLALPSPRLYYIASVIWDGTARVARAGTCLQYTPEGACARWVSLQANVTTTEGAPGWINVTYARADLGAPRAGAVLSEASVETFLVNATERDADTLNVALRRARSNDWSAYLPIYRLQHDTAGGAAGASVFVVSDEANDVQLPLLVDPALAAQLDVVSVTAEGVESGLTELSLGIRDLSRVTVPPTWDAVYYAVAVETARGATMAGYYKDADGQDFLCAPDVTVLPAAKARPDEVVWTPIEGIVSVAAGDARSGGSGGSGSITFRVPHACFGDEDAPTIEAGRLAGGVYLVRAGEVAEVDHAEREQTFALGLAPAAVAAVPWYTNPFGIDSFYDILGIAVAVVGGGVTLVAVQRKRNVLKRYLAEVEAAGAVAETRAREAALRAVRERLKADLTRGRIAESQYVIVERRLDELLSRARIDELTQAFADLPLRLVRKLQEFLGDGLMSREDLRIFLAHLDAEPWISAEGKAQIRRRVEAWVRQDDA